MKPFLFLSVLTLAGCASHERPYAVLYPGTPSPYACGTHGYAKGGGYAREAVRIPRQRPLAEVLPRLVPAPLPGEGKPLFTRPQAPSGEVQELRAELQALKDALVTNASTVNTNQKALQDQIRAINARLSSLSASEPAAVPVTASNEPGLKLPSND